jgi:integrase/recombinase XerD
MRCTEIARITVADCLFHDGRVREEIMLRAEITKGCSPRIAYISSKRLKGALERYLRFRKTQGIGLSDAKNYRGLILDFPLLFSNRNGGFALSRKVRVLDDGAVEEYLAADGLEHRFRHLYQRAGLDGCSSHSGRRTFASNLLAKGVPSETVSRMLGHSALDNSIPYLELRDDAVEAAFMAALDLA